MWVTQNEELSALNEVENLGCIPYDYEVYTGSAKGKDVSLIKRIPPLWKWRKDSRACCVLRNTY